MPVNVTYEKSALASFLDEIPGLLLNYQLRKEESALAHERAVDLKTMDQVDPKYYVYDDEGDINTAASMGAQQEAVKWQLQGATAALGTSSYYSYGREDETGGAYTMEDYNRDKSAINELTLSSDLGYNDALNIIDMGLFETDGDELIPGGASREEIAASMTEEGWWDNNKNAIASRSDEYFQGMLLNPQFVAPDKWQEFQANESVKINNQLQNIITQPEYTTAIESVNTLMDAAGAWKGKTGVYSVDEDGMAHYYDTAGNEVDLDEFVELYPATYQLLTASKPLEWMHDNYKDGGESNPVIEAIMKENPALFQNYVKPLFDDMDEIVSTRKAYEAKSLDLLDPARKTQLPKDLDTALRAFEKEEPKPADKVTVDYRERRQTLLRKGMQQPWLVAMEEADPNLWENTTDEDLQLGFYEYLFNNDLNPDVNPDAYEKIRALDTERGYGSSHGTPIKDYVISRMDPDQFNNYNQYVRQAQQEEDEEISQFSAGAIAELETQHAKIVQQMEALRAVNMGHLPKYKALYDMEFQLRQEILTATGMVEYKEEKSKDQLAREEGYAIAAEALGITVEEFMEMIAATPDPRDVIQPDPFGVRAAYTRGLQE